MSLIWTGREAREAEGEREADSPDVAEHKRWSRGFGVLLAVLYGLLFFELGRAIFR